MAARIEQSHGSNGDWRVQFEDGFRGFAARVTTVMESLRLLDEPFLVPNDRFSPEQWAVDTDRRIGEIFFGMDSALECFVFALNTVGSYVVCVTRRSGSGQAGARCLRDC